MSKLERYCAYQDRCHSEVRTKLIQLGIYGDDLEEIIVDLINDNFLNEERFACSFARGKFRIKKWGRIKIRMHLKQKKISEYCLKKAMLEIEEEDYLESLKSILGKKWKTVRVANIYTKKGKVAAFAIQKGYESWLVWDTINKYQPDF